MLATVYLRGPTTSYEEHCVVVVMLTDAISSALLQPVLW